MDVAAQANPNPPEAHRLIASDRIEGTPVRRRDGSKIGAIKRLMIDKQSGQVAYAVLRCGGFLGIGGEYRAVPWDTLKYRIDLLAYELSLSDEELAKAPSSETSEDFDWGERAPKSTLATDYRSAGYWT